MTIQELERLINEWRSGGADDHTPVLLAQQPHYPLVSAFTDDVAVVYEGEDEDGSTPSYRDGAVSHVLLCEGSQRYDCPYTTEHETDVLREAGWGR